jgi:membrane dipeptidase
MKKIIDLSRDEEEHALSVYKDSIVIDCHQDSAITEDYVQKMLESGVTAINLDGGNIDRIAKKYTILEQFSHTLTGPISLAEEIRKAKREGKIAVFLGAERAADVLDSYERSTNIDRLPLMKKLGLKTLQPCYNNRSVFADGCAEKTNGGLSSQGIELVEEMNRLDLIVDCSHVGIKTTLDVCEHAKYVAANHSIARSVCDNPRNRTDEEIHAITEKEGILGLVAFPTFIKWTDTANGVWPTVEDLLDHLDYMAELVGVKYIGIGLDLVEGTSTLGPIKPGSWLTKLSELYGGPGPDGFIQYPEGMSTVTDLPNIAKGMVARGYSDGEIRGVLGENWMRFFTMVWGG